MLAANIIQDVQISTPSPVKLLRGHTLTLNCTATTALNTRVQMTWRYPGEVSGIFLWLLEGSVSFWQGACPWVLEVGQNQHLLTPVAVWANKEAVGVVWGLGSSDVPWVCVHRYGLLMSGGFVLKYIGWYFYCMTPGGKGDCFILGNCSLGFRDEREIYHSVPGRAYLR